MVLATSGAESTTTSVIFWVLAIVSVGAALGMILSPRAVHCAVLLAVVMLSLAVLYLTAGAPFLAAVQVIVYTGAVLMLFLFVLMIVGVSAVDSLRETIRGQRLWAGLAAIALLVLLALTIGHAAIGPAAPASLRYGALPAWLGWAGYPGHRPPDAPADWEPDPAAGIVDSRAGEGTPSEPEPGDDNPYGSGEQP